MYLLESKTGKNKSINLTEQKKEKFMMPTETCPWKVDDEDNLNQVHREVFFISFCTILWCYQVI